MVIELVMEGEKQSWNQGKTRIQKENGKGKLKLGWGVGGISPIPLILTCSVFVIYLFPLFTLYSYTLDFIHVPLITSDFSSMKYAGLGEMHLEQ